MNLARFSRIALMIMAAGLLISCSEKAADRRAPSTDMTQPTLGPHTNLEGHAPSWPMPDGRDGARPSSRQAGTLPAIAPEEARNHFGQTRTVCGTVTSAQYLVRTKGQPTVLNLNRPYPDQVFTVLIWGRDRAKFSAPPETCYRGKQISVTGRIVQYRGKPEIIVNDPSQLAVTP